MPKIMIEHADFYPYRKPVRLVRSKLGAMATIVSAVVIATAVIQAGVNVRNKVYMASKMDHGMAEYELPLPSVALNLAGDMGRQKFIYNQSFYRVVFIQRVIYEGYANPERKRENIYIPAKPCTINKGSGQVNAFCPDTSQVNECQELADDGKSKCLRAQAEFASDTFRFLQIEIHPCPAYRTEDDDFECASDEDLSRLFYKSYSGVSLYIHDQVSSGEFQWTSKAYNTFEPDVWLGIEVLMKPTKVTEYDFYGQVSSVSKFLTYDSFYTRRGAAQTSNIAKMYVKYGDKSLEEDVVYFGLASSIEMIGSTWALLGMTVGAFAYAWNAAKNTNIRSTSKIEDSVAIIAQHVKKQDKEIQRTQECLRRISGDVESVELNWDDLNSLESGLRSVQAPRPTDILFSFDTTSSMSRYLDEVRQNLVNICTELLNVDCDIRISIIAHGDYCDKKHHYLLRKLDFTSNGAAITNFINNECSETAGGDLPECYEYALRVARRELSWREGTNKAVCIIGDDVPHSSITACCNVGKWINWKREARKLADMGCTIYGVQCNNNDYAKGFYNELASIGGGQYLHIQQIQAITDIFIGLTLKTADPVGRLLQEYAKKVKKQGKMTGDRNGVLQTMLGTTAFVGLVVGTTGV